ncbi:hypothetical protein [Fodinicola feengrottensis]|uniref:Secreted protein n=1 Tax=Fodinicola feengrottensis TaxID=435914 RepID=A0ABN2FRE0_9ACTN|nr:hypothetical protein [Fodinicola feengrottensis]
MNSAKIFAGAAAGLLLVLSPALTPAASAAPADAVRTSCHLAHINCTTPTVFFEGGRISIDADVNGSGTGHWWLYQDNRDNVAVCQTDFSAEAGPASWTCDIGIGSYHLAVLGGFTSTDARGDLRW